MERTKEQSLNIFYDKFLYPFIIISIIREILTLLIAFTFKVHSQYPELYLDAKLLNPNPQNSVTLCWLSLGYIIMLIYLYICYRIVVIKNKSDIHDLKEYPSFVLGGISVMLLVLWAGYFSVDINGKCM